MDRAALVEACHHLALFPLPDVILMPGAALPLHVFEPRYRSLVEDCLGGRPLSVPQIREGASHQGLPTLLPYASVGVIGAHQRLPDGRFNVLIHPLARVRLRQELPSDTAYRIFDAEVLEDTPCSDRQLSRIGERVRAMFAILIHGQTEALEGLGRLPVERIPEVLAGHLLDGMDARQAFLAENDPVTRATQVEEALLTLVGQGGSVGEA